MRRARLAFLALLPALAVPLAAEAPVPPMPPSGGDAVPSTGPTPVEGVAQWRQVSLFDWIYSGEVPYEALKQAAGALGDHSWAAQRLERGEKVPQASARELAQRLEEDPRLDPDLKARLQQDFADEADQLRPGPAQKEKQMAASLALDSSLMDDLEASIYRNNYSKGSAVGLTYINYWGGLREVNPGGMVQGQQHTFYSEGINAGLTATIDKVQFTINLAEQYQYNFAETSDASGVFDEKNGNFNSGSAMSFDSPLLNGLHMALGWIPNVELSPLLFAQINPTNRDSFFVDVLNPFGPQGNKINVIPAQDLDYPAGTEGYNGVYLKRSGASWYWPFTDTQMVYQTPSYNVAGLGDPDLYTGSLRLDEDMGSGGNWLDGSLLYAMVQTAYVDQDALLSQGIVDMPGSVVPTPSNAGNQFWGISYLPARTNSVGMGGELRMTNGSQLHVDAAASSSSWQWPAATQSYADTAFIATYTQPVGPLGLSLTLGQAGPHFLPSPRSLSRGLGDGAIQDSMANAYTAGTQNGGAELWEWPYNTVYAQKDPPANSWISMMDQPQTLTNNNRMADLKAEWHGSWITWGLYDGLQSQIDPSDANVWTQPYIEGVSAEDANVTNGYGWAQVFGSENSGANSYTNGGAPLPGTGGNDLGLFNLPTNHAANFGPGVGSMPANWQQLTQMESGTVEMTTLLSQHGVGDDTVMADSVKTLNFAGGTVLFDLGALMDRRLALTVNLVGEDRDLTTQPGLPALGPANLFNQKFTVAFLNDQVNDAFTLVATAGYETWQSQQSYFPVDAEIKEFGVGGDYHADALLSNLVLNTRVSDMYFYDTNFGARDLSIMMVSLGFSLSY